MPQKVAYAAGGGICRRRWHAAGGGTPLQGATRARGRHAKAHPPTAKKAWLACLATCLCTEARSRRRLGLALYGLPGWREQCRVPRSRPRARVSCVARVLGRVGDTGEDWWMVRGERKFTGWRSGSRFADLSWEPRPRRRVPWVSTDDGAWVFHADRGPCLFVTVSVL